MDLPLNATQEEIIQRLADFKIKAVNYAYNTMSSPNSQHLEPREVKQLTDIVLSLEDSIKTEDTEGSQARKVQRLLERYSSGPEGLVEYKNSGIIVDSQEVIAND